MPIFGPNGLEIDTQAEILASILSKLQLAFPNANPTPTSNFGQIANIEAEFLSGLQMVLLEMYISRDPNQASGTTLDGLCTITGTSRRAETFSTVEGVITFSGPGAVADGSLIRDSVKETEWEAYNGPYTDTGGPYPEEVPAFFRATTAGPITALAGTVWEIVSVSPNWESFTNPLEDATPGRFEESDESLRRRRNIEIFSQGIGAKNVIAARVSAVNTENGEVTAVRVFDNPTQNPFDSNGIPFKATNVVVETNPSPPPIALQQDICNAIWLGLGAGVEPFGTDYMQTVVPLEGNSQDVYFDLVDVVDVWIEVNLTTANVTGSGNLPIIPTDFQQLADLVREYIIERRNEDPIVIGDDVYYSQFVSYIEELKKAEEIRGVDKISLFLSDAEFGAYEDFLQIGIREKANYDTGRVKVFIDGVEY